MHRNARLTPRGRLLLCQRIEAGWPVAHAAATIGISRARAYVWWRRYQAEGVAGLEDRSSRPATSLTRTKASRERRIVALWQTISRSWRSENRPTVGWPKKRPPITSPERLRTGTAR